MQQHRWVTEKVTDRGDTCKLKEEEKMLVSMKRILEYAEANEVAIGAFNVTTLEGIMATLEAAEELNEPVIIQFAQVHEPIISVDTLGPIMVMMAEKSKVPVCVHLDHGEDLAYLKKALDMGFTSIMYDGSALDFEKNIANTCIAVEMAADYGASVEAEIGSMGREEFGSVGAEGDAVESMYTNPDEAMEFVARTGIDGLACSFGTVHGLYLTEPKLDFDIITAIREKAQIPVVMHGGSGVSAPDFKECIKRGVRKINYYTYAAKAGGEAVKEQCDKADGVVYFHDVAAWGREAMKADVIEAMKVFAGK